MLELKKKATFDPVETPLNVNAANSKDVPDKSLFGPKKTRHPTLGPFVPIKTDCTSATTMSLWVYPIVISSAASGFSTVILNICCGMPPAPPALSLARTGFPQQMFKITVENPDAAE